MGIDIPLSRHDSNYVSVPRTLAHFTVDWIGHGFNKNKFPSTIPLLQLRYIKVIEN